MTNALSCPPRTSTSSMASSRVIGTILLLTALLLASMGLSLSLGSFPTSPGEVVGALVNPEASDITLIVRELRLPRVLLAVMVGAALAVAGVLLQGIVRNPLASPDVIGITSGAAMAAVIFMTLLGGAAHVRWLPASALLGALIAALLVFMLAWKRGISPARLILVGIGLSAASGAITTLLIVISDDAAAISAYTWLTGSLYAAQWSDVFGILPWLLASLPLCLTQARHLEAMALGDQVAMGLGVNLLQSRLLLLACSVMMAGAAVAFAGGLSFVGLIAPHVARRLVGTGLNRLVPTAGLVGALIVLHADLLGRVVFLPRDLPAGIFVSGIGAPFFVYLLYRARQQGQEQ